MTFYARSPRAPSRSDSRLPTPDSRHSSTPDARQVSPVFGIDLPTYLYDATTPRRRATPGHYAYVKIAEGCDYKCAFCIIPKMRGNYRSRTIESVVQEARNLAADGVKELLLISQDTTFYGIDQGERGALPRLLRALNGVDGIEWIRMLYLYPTTITDEVIEAVAELDKVCKYIDLPLQHAADPVLKRMKRPGTRASYERLLGNIRARIPGVSLRTTFIAGFPGETEQDVDVLEQFITDVGFDHLGVFTYSHEEGTSAFGLTDDVPQAEKEAPAVPADGDAARDRDPSPAGARRRAGAADDRRHLSRARMGVARAACRPGPGHRSRGISDGRGPCRPGAGPSHRGRDRRRRSLRSGGSPPRPDARLARWPAGRVCPASGPCGIIPIRFLVWETRVGLLPTFSI